MTDQAFNPYEPPSMEVDKAVQKPLGGGEYRLEKNGLVMREPFRLPRICFWSGLTSDLTDCEFQIRVMPRWWAFVMPLLIFGQQIFVIPLMQVVMPRFSTPNPAMSPIIVGTMIGILPGILILLMLAMMRFAGRKVTVYGSYNEQSVLTWRRKMQKVMLGIVIAIAAVFGSIRIGSGWLGIFITGALLAVGIVLFMSLRFRKPWSYIAGSLTKDGEIAITGFRPEFFKTLHRLKRMSSWSKEDEI